MIIYEVNISVDEEIANEYLLWLRKHIDRLLQLDGFLHADCFEAGREREGKRELVVHYHLRDRESLEDYLARHADRMRREGTERFPGRFTAFRRVLEPRLDVQTTTG